jgi:hypothetical protein
MIITEKSTIFAETLILLNIIAMQLKEHKSALATLATLGITAIAAGATAFVKIRKKRKQRLQQDAEEEASNGHLTADQMMVYNEAVRAFITINERIYELRKHRKELQPLIKWLATDGERPAITFDQEELEVLANEIEVFLTTQQPFINACLSTVSDEGLTYADSVHAPIDGTFDTTLDEEPTGADVKDGTPVSFVLKLGYFFPESSIAIHPVKAIVLV